MNAPARLASPESRTCSSAGLALRRLEASVAGLLPLPGLSAVGYARGHALFEARSDQRALITEWLCLFVLDRAASPTRVLSIGCGDGSVDVEVARTLARSGQHVEYAGIEPHGPVADCFLARLSGVPGVHAVVDRSVLADATLAELSYDIVLAVHSLYYVPDLVMALTAARRAVAPGGVLVVLHAPREQLNQLVDVLAPDQNQQFSQAVEQALAEGGTPVRRIRLDATLDLTPTENQYEAAVIDFAVQVKLPDSLRSEVVDVLREAALPLPGLRVPHPVDAFVVGVSGTYQPVRGS